MAKITLDGREIEATVGAPLLEVAKQNGFYISNLCYIDGLPPYAGCRMCLVEIEGMRGLQLACTSRVADGMVVRTTTEAVKEARKAVLSIILANHSDRCLTCHRRTICMPGDVCLRDNVVTHRCVTCPKNYRCELQTTCQLVEMAKYEPWVKEERTYYEFPQPPADRANPWLEFDPQMCIICTRCVRACADIRHTNAITLAGRGFSTRIEFGAGGPVHESTCDFCGTCIDVCPTATLMEKPNKWLALQTDEWVSTTCNSCSVGCTISLGVKSGAIVQVKPDRLNPFSDDQLCVRGRFHYDAIKEKDYLQRHLVRRGPNLSPAPLEEAVQTALTRLATIAREYGGQAIGFLGSPLTVNEENYLLQKLAREVFTSNNIDFTSGQVARSIAQALIGAFGTEALPADLCAIPTADVIVAVGTDLEGSHNVAALRIKDAVVRKGAKLIIVSPKYGELNDFQTLWLRPEPGGEAAVLYALAAAVAEGREALGTIEGREHLGTTPPDVAGVDAATFTQAVEVLRTAADQAEQGVMVIYAPAHIGASLAGEIAKAAANLAIAVRGEEAAKHLVILPTDANVHGARDMGVAPDVLPGHHRIENPGWGLSEMLQAARDGKLKALVIIDDNPMLFAPDKPAVRAALEALEFLLVIDSELTDTAKLAHVVLADVHTYGKYGTFVNADRRILKLAPARRALGEQRPALELLAVLGQGLASALGKDVSFAYNHPQDVTAEIATRVPAYAGIQRGFVSGKAYIRDEPTLTRFQAPTPRSAGGQESDQLLLTTDRTLYHSLEGAAIRSPEADKLHREEVVEINPEDATRLGIDTDDQVVLTNGRSELLLRTSLTRNVRPGTVFVPLLYDGGAVTALFPAEEPGQAFPLVRVKAAVRT